ncbi:MAG: transcription antitermination protein NusB, partial [Chloroflexota bacterium]
DFARRLAEDVERRRSHIDELIAKLAPERPLSRIDAVDLAVLRVAVAELTAEWPEMTPPSVVVDEAVELARLFGAEHSPRFVNGALGAMLR